MTIFFFARQNKYLDYFFTNEQRRLNKKMN